MATSSFNHNIIITDTESAEKLLDALEKAELKAVCSMCPDEDTPVCDTCEKRVCRVCGCTWNNPCPGGCYWVEWDLCSSCRAQGCE